MLIGCEHKVAKIVQGYYVSKFSLTVSAMQSKDGKLLIVVNNQ